MRNGGRLGKKYDYSVDTGGIKSINEANYNLYIPPILIQYILVGGGGGASGGSAEPGGGGGAGGMVIGEIEPAVWENSI